MKHSPANEGAAPIMRGLLRRPAARPGRASTLADDKSNLHFRSTFDTIINILYNYEKATCRSTMRPHPRAPSPHHRVVRGRYCALILQRCDHVSIAVSHIELEFSLKLLERVWVESPRLWEVVVLAFIACA